MASRSFNITKLFVGNLPWTISKREYYLFCNGIMFGVLYILSKLNCMITKYCTKFCSYKTVIYLLGAFTDELKEYFGKYGPVSLSQVIFDREKGFSRGFGFIKYSDEKAYDAVLAQEKHQLEGNIVSAIELNKILC
ncbi:hypothetical protein CHUAL_003348 [Chamberlinius hualienensis]